MSTENIGKQQISWKYSTPLEAEYLNIALAGFSNQGLVTRPKIEVIQNNNNVTIRIKPFSLLIEPTDEVPDYTDENGNKQVVNLVKVTTTEDSILVTSKSVMDNVIGLGYSYSFRNDEDEHSEKWYGEFDLITPDNVDSYKGVIIATCISHIIDNKTIYSVTSQGGDISDILLRQEGFDPDCWISLISPRRCKQSYENKIYYKFNKIEVRKHNDRFSGVITGNFGKFEISSSLCECKVSSDILIEGVQYPNDYGKLDNIYNSLVLNEDGLTVEMSSDNLNFYTDNQTGLGIVVSTSAIDSENFSNRFTYKVVNNVYVPSLKSISSVTLNYPSSFLIPCDKDGDDCVFDSAEGDIEVVCNGIVITSQCTFEVVESSKVSGTIDKSGHFNITGLNVDIANFKFYVYYLTTKTLGSVSVIKAKQGEEGMQGLNGENAYLHIAYSNSQDGTEDFSTTDGQGKKYIGQYSDNSEEDSQNPSVYTWTKIKGDNAIDYQIDCPFVFNPLKDTQKTIKFEFYHSDDETRESIEGYYIIIDYDINNNEIARIESTEKSHSVEYETSENSYKVECSLYSDSLFVNLLDKEYVERIEDGGNSISVHSKNDNIVINCEEDGTIKTSKTLTCELACYSGGDYTDGTITVDSSFSSESIKVKITRNPHWENQVYLTGVVTVTVSNNVVLSDTSIPLTVKVDDTELLSTIEVTCVKNGVSGTNNCTIALYTISNSIPKKLSENTIRKCTSATFEFESSNFYFNTLPDTTTSYTDDDGNVWSRTYPDDKSSHNEKFQVYVIYATAFNKETSDTIEVTDWSEPKVFSSDGFNVATAYLYQRSIKSPSKPTGTLTYSFKGASGSKIDGSGKGNWSEIIPSEGSGDLWVIVATAASQGDTDTILSTEWCTPQILSKDGIVINMSTDTVYVQANQNGIITDETTAKVIVQVVKGFTSLETSDYTIENINVPDWGIWSDNTNSRVLTLTIPTNQVLSSREISFSIVYKNVSYNKVIQFIVNKDSESLLTWTPVFDSSLVRRTGTTFKKISETEGWDSQVVSKSGLNGCVSVSGTLLSKGRIIFGLSTYPDNSDKFNSVTYGFYFTLDNDGNQIVCIYESGKLKYSTDSAKINDVGQIVYTGNNVKYYLNGELIYTSSQEYSESLLYYDCLLYTSGISIGDVEYTSGSVADYVTETIQWYKATESFSDVPTFDESSHDDWSQDKFPDDWNSENPALFNVTQTKWNTEKSEYTEVSRVMYYSSGIQQSIRKYNVSNDKSVIPSTWKDRSEVESNKTAPYLWEILYVKYLDGTYGYYDRETKVFVKNVKDESICQNNCEANIISIWMDTVDQYILPSTRTVVKNEDGKYSPNEINFTFYKKYSSDSTVSPTEFHYIVTNSEGTIIEDSEFTSYTKSSSEIFENTKSITCKIYDSDDILIDSETIELITDNVNTIVIDLNEDGSSVSTNYDKFTESEIKLANNVKVYQGSHELEITNISIKSKPNDGFELTDVIGLETNEVSFNLKITSGTSIPNAGRIIYTIYFINLANESCGMDKSFAISNSAQGKKGDKGDKGDQGAPGSDYMVDLTPDQIPVVYDSATKTTPDCSTYIYMSHNSEILDVNSYDCVAKVVDDNGNEQEITGNVFEKDVTNNRWKLTVSSSYYKEGSESVTQINIYCTTIVDDESIIRQDTLLIQKYSGITALDFELSANQIKVDSNGEYSPKEITPTIYKKTSSGQFRTDDGYLTISSYDEDGHLVGDVKECGYVEIESGDTYDSSADYRVQMKPVVMISSGSNVMGSKIDGNTLAAWVIYERIIKS